MSEINYDFFAYFSDKDAQKEFSDFLHNLKNGDVVNYKKVLDRFEIKLSEYENFSIFHKYLEIDTNELLIEGSVQVHSSRDEEINILTKAFVNFAPDALLSILTQETGRTKKLGFLDGKKSTAKNIIDFVVERYPEFALKLAIQQNSNKELKKQLACQNPNTLYKGIPLAFFLVDKISLLRQAIKNGLDVNTMSPKHYPQSFIEEIFEGETLLNYAVRVNESPSVKALLKGGANPNLANQFKEYSDITPIFYAESDNIMPLLKAGALIDAENNFYKKNNCMTPVYEYAISLLNKIYNEPESSEYRKRELKAFKKTVSMFIKSGDSINTVYDNFGSLLSFSSPLKDFKKVLIDLGATVISEPDIENEKDVKLKLNRALWYGKNEVLSKTLELQDDITQELLTDLYTDAIYLDRQDIVSLMSKYGMHPAHCDYRDIKYYEIAEEFGHIQLAEEMKLIAKNDEIEFLEIEKGISNFINEIRETALPITGFPEQRDFWWKDADFSSMIQYIDFSNGTNDYSHDVVLAYAKSLTQKVNSWLRKEIGEIKFIHYTNGVKATIVKSGVQWIVHKSDNGEYKIAHRSI